MAQPTPNVWPKLKSYDHLKRGATPIPPADNFTEESKSKNKIRNTPWGDITYLNYKKKIELSPSQIKELIKYSKKKRNIYFQRLSGILNSMIGKKSWYRPNINKN